LINAGEERLKSLAGCQSDFIQNVKGEAQVSQTVRFSFATSLVVIDKLGFKIVSTLKPGTTWMSIADLK